jgi:hypothetical protein
MGKLFEKVILKQSKGTLKKETCLMQVSLVSCTTQHDTSVYKAYGPSDLKYEQQYVYSCSILQY